MHLKTASSVALLAGALLVLGSVSPLAAGASAPNAAQPGSGVREVLLPTGDRLQVLTGPDGQQSVLALPSASGHQESYSVRQIGSDTYVVPSSAQPFIGRGLDLGLFDVSRLPAFSSTARIPVRFSGATPAGVTRTSPGSGYLTEVSAAAFGAALRRQIGAAAAAGRQAEPVLPAGTTSVSAPGAATPSATSQVTPDFDMWTVKLRVLDGSGQPAQFGSIYLINTDDSTRYVGSPTLFDGTARVSLPAGNYSAIANVEIDDASGYMTEARQVSVSDIAVTKDATITMDTRKAQPLVATAARPTVQDDVVLDWQRLAAVGIGKLDQQWMIPPEVHTYEAPSKYARVGTLHFAVAVRLSAPAGSADPYTYRLVFSADGVVPSSQQYRATPTALATLKATYYTDVPGQVATAGHIATLANGVMPPQYAEDLTLPLARTEYVTADPAVSWQDEVAPRFPSTPSIDPPRSYVAGSTRSVDWFRGPLVPGFDSDAGAAGSFVCPACRTASGMYVDVSPTVDSAGHAELPFTWYTQTAAATHLVLSTGKKVLVDSTRGLPVTATVAAGKAHYDLVVDETRDASWIRLSTSSHTEWTFSTAAPTQAALPPAWNCLVIVGDCAVLPLLTVRYQLGVDTDGTSPPGPDSLDLTIAHLPGAAAAPVTDATVRVSFDDGATWTPTSLASRGAGQYHARWTNPASADGGDVAIEVTARDAAGATVTQVVHHAYTITPAGSAK